MRWAVQAGDGRPCGGGAGGDDQLIVGEVLLLAVLVGDNHLAGGGVDGLGGVLQQQAQAGVLELGQMPVGKVAPVGHLAREVVGQPADGEVGEGVGDQHGDLCGGVELAGAQGGRDAGVAAADHQQPHLASS